MLNWFPEQILRPLQFNQTYKVHKVYLDFLKCVYFRAVTKCKQSIPTIIKHIIHRFTKTLLSSNNKNKYANNSHLKFCRYESKGVMLNTIPMSFPHLCPTRRITRCSSTVVPQLSPTRGQGAPPAHQNPQHGSGDKDKGCWGPGSNNPRAYTSAASQIQALGKQRALPTAEAPRFSAC